MATQAAKFTDLVGQTHDGAVGLPAAGTTVSTKLEPGAYTQFLFKMDQIDSVALSPSGALEMKLTNGATLIIENFQDLANSAESCGRDTIFQLLKDVATGQESGLQIVNISPDSLLRALDPTFAQDKTITVSEPAIGITREVMMEPGQNYKFNFDWANTAKTVDGTNLMLSFKNGGLVILRDFVPVTAGDLPPVMTLADGSTVDASQLIATSCTPGGTALPLAAKAPDIEPAAGEPAPKPAFKKAATVYEPAQSLADIEPAAGGGNSPASGGRGGAGFSSGIDPANLNGLKALGPIGPTSLLYGIPSVKDYPVSGVPAAPEKPPVNPPEKPGLTVCDECVYEDGGVGLRITATAPADAPTVITLSGIPAGWTVEPGLGTYNAASGTWSLSIPAGGSFSGGPILHPPHDLDSDIPALSVIATATSGTSGLSSTSSGTIKVVTDAVADMPNLNVTPSAHADTGTAIPLNITSSLNDTDGSEVLSICITGLPAGAQLSAGTRLADGSYALTAAQLASLKVIPAAGYVGTFTLTVTATATETNLSGEECTLKNNVACLDRTITVEVSRDDQPIIVNAQNAVDETNLGPITVNGTVNVNYGTDGPGTVSALSAASFVSGGSRLNGALTSNGVPVTVTLTGDTYTGKAGSVTVFTLHVNANGTYAFKLLDNLDHANASDPNDVITLSFGIKATDADTDSSNGTITISVADDAPIARDDTPAAVGGVAMGNLTTNDTLGQDTPAKITAITFNGVTTPVAATGTTTIAGLYGTLVVAATGAYTYTGKNGVSGTDTFTYTLVDGDGDPSSAKLRVTIADGLPTIGDALHTIDETNLGPITVNGQLTSSYGADGAGAIAAENRFTSTGSKTNDLLSSGGVPVTVTLTGNTYTGKAGSVTVFTLQVNADGSYVFKLLDNLDHANKLDPNDIITLNFGVKITDSDGDSDTGTIVINVKDDAPVPTPDQNTANECKMVSGNVLLNDASTENPYVSFVTFGKDTYTVAPTGQTVIYGAYGTLTIERDGDYTYTPNCEIISTTMSPTCDDVIASNSQPVLTKNGITIEAIDPATGHLANDLSWVYDNFNPGNTGIGVNDGPISGPHEAMRITFGAEPADAMWITVGNWSSNEQASGTLMAKVYLVGSSTPVTVPLTDGVAGPYNGIVSYKIDAETLFNNVPFTKVELYLNDPSNQCSGTLINVTVERYSEGTDVFGYTVTDFDGDSAVSTLSINTDNDTLVSTALAPVTFADPVTAAIDQFVTQTAPASGITGSAGGGTPALAIAPLTTELPPLSTETV